MAESLVEVLVRSKGPGPRNALVEFDPGEHVVVPTYAGGRGATLRLKEVRTERLVIHPGEIEIVDREVRPNDSTDLRHLLSADAGEVVVC